MKNALSTVTKLSNADWLKNSEWMLDLVKTPQPSFEKPLPLPFQSRLIRVDEINEEGHQAYRQAVTVKFFETPRSVFLLPCSARKLLAVDCHERSAVAHSCRSLRYIR